MKLATHWHSTPYRRVEPPAPTRINSQNQLKDIRCTRKNDSCDHTPPIPNPLSAIPNPKSLLHPTGATNSRIAKKWHVLPAMTHTCHKAWKWSTHWS